MGMVVRTRSAIDTAEYVPVSLGAPDRFSELILKSIANETPPAHEGTRR